MSQITAAIRPRPLSSANAGQSPLGVLAIDGNSIAYRAYFALPTSIVDKTGAPCNATYGFMSMLIRVLREWRPAGVVVAFDSAWPTLRHRVFPEYKAGRIELKPDLLNQVPRLRMLLDHLGICCCSADGIEADDLLAAISQLAVHSETQALLVDSRRKLSQCSR